MGTELFPIDHNDNSILVAMSGGVDSSVAAALLKDKGYKVTGVMFRLWSLPGKEDLNKCCTPDAVNQARRVAARIGIPFYVVDARIPFRKIVVQAFIDGYGKGITPNPCFICNKEFRWNFLLTQADAFGIYKVATGHYAQVVQNRERYSLLKGVDATKDQSYMLAGLGQNALKRTILPLGLFNKDQIRQIAREKEIGVAEKPDSQDLCFLGDEDYRVFLEEYSPGSLRNGPIINVNGDVIGSHQGLANYTIGQRKKLEVSSPEALYVLRKDVQNNSIIVGSISERGTNKFIMREINWVSGESINSPFEGNVKIRYRSKEVLSKIIPLDTQSARVEVYSNIRDITPGQIAVVYINDEVICSGTISFNDI